jgi:hypothetical protein
MHTSFVSDPVAMYPSEMERPTKFWSTGISKLVIQHSIVREYDKSI